MSKRIQTVPPWYIKYGRAITILLLAWLAAGTVAYYYLLLTFKPWTGALGVAGSAQRVFFMGFGCYLYWLPIPLLCMHLYVQHQEWLAEDMGQRYEEGKYYPVFTTKRLITMALAMALFGASGAIRVIDIPGIVMSFVNVLYGPIEAFLALGFGYFFIRGPIFLGQFDFFQLSRNLIYDGGHACLSAFMFRKWLRTRLQTQKLSIPVVYVIYGLLREYYHMLAYDITTRVWINPAPLYLVGWIQSLILPVPPLMVPGRMNVFLNHTVGFFMAMAVTKYVWPSVEAVRSKGK